MMRKIGLTSPVSRLIRKSKLVFDKNDANSGGTATVKSLSGSGINVFESTTSSFRNSNHLMSGCLKSDWKICIVEHFGWSVL